MLQKLPDVSGASGKANRFKMEIGSGEIQTLSVSNQAPTKAKQASLVPNISTMSKY